MKILMVTERYIPIWGGAENQLRQLIPHLTARGCEVSIVTRRWYADWPKAEVVDGVRVIRLGRAGTGKIAVLAFTLSLLVYIIINRLHIDVLHSHGAVNMGALCSIMARLLGLKNVAKIASAGRIPRFSRTKVGQLLLGWFQRSDAIISMTDEIDKELAAVSTNQAALHRITNGVDGNRFKTVPDDIKRSWRRDQGLDTEARIILFSSRLVHGKGLDILLKAWPEVAAEHANAHLYIMGDGADQPDSIESEMKAKVGEEALQRVRFLGSLSTPEDILAVADIFVFPSRREGFPNALMEALVTGLIVVASDIGGVIPLIRNNQTGILFKSEDHKDLAFALSGVLDDFHQSRQLGLQARQEMLAKYGFHQIAARYVELYETILTGASEKVHFLESRD
jgi:glycosyltransferase involved in cell wall biosynthesis